MSLIASKGRLISSLTVTLFLLFLMHFTAFNYKGILEGYGEAFTSLDLDTLRSYIEETIGMGYLRVSIWIHIIDMFFAVSMTITFIFLYEILKEKVKFRWIRGLLKPIGFILIPIGLLDLIETSAVISFFLDPVTIDTFSLYLQGIINIVKNSIFYIGFLSLLIGSISLLFKGGDKVETN